MYETIDIAIQQLRERGYTTDFNITFDNIKCAETGICFSPAQFEIVERYKFTENADSFEASIVYAVESKDGTMKGILVYVAGPNGEAADDELVRKLSTHDK